MYKADRILEDQIEAEQEEGGRETVGAFTRHVEQGVEDRLNNIRDDTGNDIGIVAGDVMSTVRSWSESKRALLSTGYEIDDTARKGAAAWFESGSGRTVFDDRVMDVDADRGYWSRTRRHEEKHHSEANVFNSGAITFGGKTYAARPTLTEGRATQHQPDSDLVPSYIQYRNVFRKIALYLGARSPIDAAIESGDIAGLQERINAVECHGERSRTIDTDVASRLRSR